jgi:hypothetical protein
MKQAGSLNFKDADSGDDTYVSVRYDEGTVALAVSLMQDGDIEVFMSKEDARVLLEALRVALS